MLIKAIQGLRFCVQYTISTPFFKYVEKKTVFDGCKIKMKTKIYGSFKNINIHRHILLGIRTTVMNKGKSVLSLFIMFQFQINVQYSRINAYISNTVYPQVFSPKTFLPLKLPLYLLGSMDSYPTHIFINITQKLSRKNLQK